MNNSETTTCTYASAHLAWLACLGCLLHMVRMQGMLSIEDAVDDPERAAPFARFPQVLEQPYLTFATDVLRMMVGGQTDPDDLQVYADHAIAGFLQGQPKVDESLLRTIWLTLWAGLKQFSPQVAIEYGRQGIPAGIKPSFKDVEEAHRASRDAWRNTSEEPMNMDGRIEAFIQSIGGGRGCG